MLKEEQQESKKKNKKYDLAAARLAKKQVLQTISRKGLLQEF